jgi:hypothetical protein
VKYANYLVCCDNGTILIFITEMDTKSIQAAVMGTAAFVIVVDDVVLNNTRSTSFIPREPHVNQELK